MAISTICSRGASGFAVHQFAIDCVPPTSISASRRSARCSSTLSSALAPGSCEMSTVTSAVTCSSIRFSTAVVSGSAASRNSMRHASRRSSTNAKKASRPMASRSAPDSSSTPTRAAPMRWVSSRELRAMRSAYSSCFEAKCS
jgi:hypothetical protein